MDSTREIVVSCHRNSEEVSMSTVSAGLSEKTLQPKTVILAAEARLRRSSFPELRLVFCTFHHGILTLTGRVSSRYLLQLASTIVEGLHGVEEIDNQLVVV